MLVYQLLVDKVARHAGIIEQPAFFNTNVVKDNGNIIISAVI